MLSKENMTFIVQSLYLSFPFAYAFAFVYYKYTLNFIALGLAIWLENRYLYTGIFILHDDAVN